MIMERLDKYLASRGTGSRREVQQLIKSGAVTVDGAVCKKPETKLSDAAEVLVRGQAVGERFVYLMLNKPAGVVSATEDKRDKTVIDILPAEWKNRGLFPARRFCTPYALAQKACRKAVHRAPRRRGHGGDGSAFS